MFIVYLSGVLCPLLEVQHEQSYIRCPSEGGVLIPVYIIGRDAPLIFILSPDIESNGVSHHYYVSEPLLICLHESTKFSGHETCLPLEIRYLLAPATSFRLASSRAAWLTRFVEERVSQNYYCPDVLVPHPHSHYIVWNLQQADQSSSYTPGIYHQIVLLVLVYPS